MFTNLLIGIKPEHEYDRLLETARKAAAPGARVHLASFVRVGKDGDEPERIARAEEMLEQIAGRLTEDGYAATHAVAVIGVGAGHELTRLAVERESDLLVLGLGKRSRVGKALLGSDAQSAIIGSPCPVLARHLDF